MIMKLTPVKFYGLFGKFRPIEFHLKDSIIKKLERRLLLDIDNRCYEIISLFKSGSQLYINLKLLPNPHLYEPRKTLYLNHK